MKRSAAVSVAVLFVLLATAGLVSQQPDRALTRSTFGTAPFGFKAVYDLLQESGIAVARNLGRFDELPEKATVWWLGGGSLCGGSAEGGAAGAWSGAEWLERGGTAVVFAPLDECEMGKLPISVVATADGEPFVLERQVGEGRIVVVGDDEFLSNAHLATADAAPLVMDLVRRYGAPIFDERDHGFGAVDGSLAYLLRSPALAVFAGLALLGLGVAWWGASVPPPAAGAAGPPAPTLEAYVTSLATLYSRASDHGAVAGEYRDLTLSQLRRHLGLPPDTPAAVLIGSLARQHRLGADEARLLREPPVVASAADLRRLAQTLDRIQRKAMR